MDMDFDDMDFDEDEVSQVQQQEPVVDPLDGHTYLTFLLGSIRHERCAKLCTMEIGGHVEIDWEVIETLTKDGRARDIVGLDTPFACLFQITTEDSYRGLTIEFLSSFIYKPHPDDYVEDPKHLVHEIFFHLVSHEF
ncbi:hypothetical protein HanPI659440_Chr03g0110011 [Helianthus annuus]|nr:hypothetical protein HanPI659440_Chr03g0110011 [Helianthus annuus]